MYPNINSINIVSFQIFFFNSFSNYEHLRSFYNFLGIDADKIGTEHFCKKIFYDHPTRTSDNSLCQLMQHLNEKKDCPLHHTAYYFCTSLREQSKQAKEKNHNSSEINAVSLKRNAKEITSINN